MTTKILEEILGYPDERSFHASEGVLLEDKMHIPINTILVLSPASHTDVLEMLCGKPLNAVIVARVVKKMAEHVYPIQTVS